MRTVNTFLFSLFILMVQGCVSNPLNHVTSARYALACKEAESKRDWDAAIEACYRATANVDWGNLSPALKSSRLYDFGRVLRLAGKFEQAKEVLVESLRIEETLSGEASEKTGRRLAELAATLFELQQISEGLTYVDRLVSLKDKYSGAENKFIAALLYVYGKSLREQGNTLKSKEYIGHMETLGFTEGHFESLL